MLSISELRRIFVRIESGHMATVVVYSAHELELGDSGKIGCTEDCECGRVEGSELLLSPPSQSQR
jgi:hypothetical protein